MRLIGSWSDDDISILLDQFGNNICIGTYDQTALDPKKNKKNRYNNRTTSNKITIHNLEHAEEVVQSK